MATIGTIRLHPNYLYGTLSDNLLGNSGGNVTMNSTALGGAPVTTQAGSYPNYFVAVLDPQSAVGAPEIVYVTVHAGSATTATVVRAQEGSALRAHTAGEFWVATETSLDFTRYHCNALLANGGRTPTAGTEYASQLSTLDDYWTMITAGADSTTISAGGKVTIPVNGWWDVTWTWIGTISGPAEVDVRAIVAVNNNSGTPLALSGSDSGSVFANPIATAEGYYYAAGTTLTPLLSVSSNSDVSVDTDSRFSHFSVALRDLG